jgi:hypothetical protein
MIAKERKVPVRYNGHQLDDKTVVNIDYLIINLVGTMQNIESYYNEKITFEQKEYGTKVFASAHTIKYNGQTMGTIYSAPRSKVIESDLCQFQFENHTFYTSDLSYLRMFVFELTDITGLRFKAVNRLDIAVDVSDKKGFYSGLVKDIVNDKMKIGGRSKAFSLHYETSEGKPVLNGYSVGKRSSSRYLRVYNKTVEIAKKPKEYISNMWAVNGLDPNNIWRFEYQLNSDFFRDLKHNEIQDMTWGVFDRFVLVKLLEIAQKNHFEIKFNTKKSETNKELTYDIFDWGKIAKSISEHQVANLARLKRIIEPSMVIHKRMIKSCFREYYNSGQDLTYMLPVNAVIQQFKTDAVKPVTVKLKNPYSGRRNNVTLVYKDDCLSAWFEEKYRYYLAEFQSLSRKPYDFDYDLFKNHLDIFL